MKLDVVELTPTIGVFDLRGVTPAFLNPLRRTMMSDVPKLAIEDVTIYDNTSALFDEMVAHRLSLLPVPTDLNAFNRRWKDNNGVPKEAACTSCSGEGCANCTVLYTLSKEGPCMVLSGDLVPAADAKFKIADPKVPIVKLLEGQRIMLEAGAIIGIGSEHAKWQPVNAVGYMEYPSITIGNASVPPAVLEKMQKNAPPGALAFEGSNFRVADTMKALAYLRSVKDLYGLDHVTIGHDNDRFLFRVETDASLSPQAAIRKALSIVMEKLKTVESDVTKLKPIETPA
jgi:DNA-directed RNA polymerase subunit D